MIIKDAKFVISNSDVRKCPEGDTPEYAFIGRSNVGKSSLINMLTGRKGLAMTSSTPGKTMLINHFLVNDSWYIVDLPGYGYASTGAVEQEKWGRMINRYLETSDDIEEVILFVDIRHDPSKLDIQMFDYVTQVTGFEPIVILTKMDKINRSQIKKQTAAIRKALHATENCTMIPFSSQSKQGLEDIYAIIDEIMDAPETPETQA